MSTSSKVFVTFGENVLSNTMIDLKGIAPCQHKEADTRMFVHARHGVEEGSKRILVKANDTDVIVIGIDAFQVLNKIGMQQLLVTYGQGKNLRWIPIHDLYSSLGQQRSKAILFFHAFTGCDVTSGFRGKGKRTAWQTWDVFPEASEVFQNLSQSQPIMTDSDLKILERFVVIMYDKSCSAESVDDARMELFARKQRAYQSIPPTKAALIQHIKRASYQAGCIWSQSTIRQPEPQSPSDWGWTHNGDSWQVFGTTLPPIAATGRQLSKYGCNAGCKGGANASSLVSTIMPGAVVPVMTR